MNNKVAIVTHHYVRDEENPQASRAGSYSISVSDFIKRLDYFITRYSIITPDMFINSIKYNAALPENAMLLTFDDGYIDHYNNVFPVLMEKGIKAFFFPSAIPIFEKKVLNTNKIQMILDIKDKELLHYEISKVIEKVCTRSELTLFEVINDISNLTEKENILWSYLEWELPRYLANKIIELLFNKLINLSEKELCEKKYMSFKQLMNMKQNGMIFGCHGYNHYCMGYVNDRIKNDEINKSLRLIRLLNGSDKDWVMCYPYGSFDRSLISIIKKKGCIAGLTTRDGKADLQNDNLFILPRIDITNSRFTVNQ